MTDTTKAPEDGTPDRAWRLLLAGVALTEIVATIVVQLTQEAVIPPLIVQDVLFVVGLVLLVSRPRIGGITIGIVAVLALLVNLPFVAEDLAHPESFWSFVPAALAVLGGLVGLIALVAVLRRSEGGPAGIIGAVAIAAVVGIVAIAVVQSGGQEDDASQEGDFGMFAADIAFDPDAITAPAGDIGIHVGNDDLIRHNFSIDELEVDEELPSKAFVRIALTDVEPGEYRYYCNIEGHEDMEGTLTVQ